MLGGSPSNAMVAAPAAKMTFCCPTGRWHSPWLPKSPKDTDSRYISLPVQNEVTKPSSLSAGCLASGTTACGPVQAVDCGPPYRWQFGFLVRDLACEPIWGRCDVPWGALPAKTEHGADVDKFDPNSGDLHNGRGARKRPKVRDPCLLWLRQG
jgi:hypothetical protein